LVLFEDLLEREQLVKDLPVAVPALAGHGLDIIVVGLHLLFIVPLSDELKLLLKEALRINVILS
jgi:hypothetical protein